jgi:hypothetical protein
LLDLGDSSGSTNEHDLINVSLLHACVVQDLLDGLQSLLEEVIAKFLESSSSDGLREIESVDQVLNGDLGLVDGREVSLGLLDLTLELLHGSGVILDLLVVLLLEDLDEVLSQTLVKVLTAQVGVT